MEKEKQRILTERLRELDWVPEAEESFRRRYRILEALARRGCAGRRRLSLLLAMPEGRIRNDIAVLTGLSLVRVTRGGIALTERGLAELENIGHEDPRRVRCIHTEEALSRYLKDCTVYVAADAFGLAPYAGEEGVLRPEPWRKYADRMDSALLHTLGLRDAETCVGGMILSREGKPLYRMEETPSCRALLGGDGVTGSMLYAAMRYFKPEEMYMLAPEGLELLDILQEREKYHADNRD